jgi:hypothetical protein
MKEKRGVLPECSEAVQEMDLLENVHIHGKTGRFLLV